eukprot:COSAG06_NODE_4935_length_3849_cov_14.543200_2_plen_194_part_00
MICCAERTWVADAAALLCGSDMALAASAPIKLDSVGLIDPLRYYRIVTDAAEKIQPGCTVAVRKAFVALRSASPSEAQQALGLCQQPTAGEYGWNDLEFWITQYFATMAMFNCELQATAFPTQLAEEHTGIMSVLRRPSSDKCLFLVFHRSTQRVASATRLLARHRQRNYFPRSAQRLQETARTTLQCHERLL